MRHRIFVDEIYMPVVEVLGEEFHHAVRVVRVKQGEEVEMFDKKGKMSLGTIHTIDPHRVIIRVGAPVPSRESKLAIHLAMAIVQLEKFELVLQKATELGVQTIIPLVTDRIELRKERYLGKMERWERIIFEAVKQSGRAVIPTLESPAPFTQIVERGGAKMFFDADADTTERPESLDDVTLFIGPEGGWTDEELALARHHGCTFERLGPRRLRAETAAIAATAIISARYGDI